MIGAGTYPVSCYRAALDQMPEDVRIYSSAESDIKRALLAVEAAPTAAKAKKVQKSTKAKASSTKGSGDGLSPLIVIAIGAALLAAVGSGLALTR